MSFALTFCDFSSYVFLHLNESIGRNSDTNCQSQRLLEHSWTFHVTSVQVTFVLLIVSFAHMSANSGN